MVCTGNICRSPFAEYLLIGLISDLEGIVVGSAGTHAMVRQQMFPEAQKVAESYGVEHLDSHRARQFLEDILDGSDLILTMTRQQRREVVELSLRVTRRAFTLREFARLITATSDAVLALDIAPVSRPSPDRCRAAVGSVALSRSQAPSVSRT